MIKKSNTTTPQPPAFATLQFSPAEFLQETGIDLPRLRGRISLGITRASISHDENTIIIGEDQFKMLRSCGHRGESAHLLVSDVRTFCQAEFEARFNFSFDRARTRIQNRLTRTGEIVDGSRIRISEREAGGLQYLDGGPVPTESGAIYEDRPSTVNFGPIPMGSPTVNTSWRELESESGLDRAQLRRLLRQHAKLVSAHWNAQGVTFKTGLDLERFQHAVEDPQ